MATARPDPLPRRVGDVAYVIAASLSGLLWSAVADAAQRIAARARAKRHRVFSVTRRT